MRTERTRACRLLLLLMALVILAAAVSGCMSSEDNGEEAKIKLYFRHVWIQKHNGSMEQIITDAIRRFEKEHPNVRVDFEGMHQTQHREQKLKSEMVTGNPPDLFVLFGGAELEPYVRAERLLDLTDYLKESGLYEQFHDLSLWTFDQRVYGLPVEGFTEPVFYNKKLFAELGLSVPTNWEQLTDVIRRLNAAGVTPMAIGNSERWPGAAHYHYFLERYAGNDPIQRIVKGEGSFLLPEYEEATERFLEFARLKPFAPQPGHRAILEAEQMFLQGKAAMFLSGSWEVSIFPPGADFADQVGVFHFPNVTDQSGVKQSLASGYTFGIGLSANLTGEKRRMALELLKAIYSPEVQQRVVYEAYRMPSMKVEVDERRIGPVYKQIAEQLESADATFIPYDNVLPPAMHETFFQVTDELIEDRITAKEALQRLENERKRYNTMIGK
ncbi:extracellular solute-binding protein [Paenibacillus sp. YYML68]|uniref:extracellular solute-binding protein n=1 Tax=Paenibacillus sp. YYML68 TaxID=2909250 RepID=UPI0024938046|nr:extracellular solute-binding protein [Paenibacillus sp. YYML68]